MSKIKFGILGMTVFILILLFIYNAGLQSNEPLEILPWCYDMMGSPEEIDLIVVFRTNKFNVLTPFKAFRIGDKWFLAMPESLNTAISPIREQFIAWQKMP